MYIAIVFLFTTSLFSAREVLSCRDPGNTEPPKKDWWQTAQFYQIYPRSFMDSNGDGIGDLNGITSKLDYLKNIGVTAAWLSPIFKSPMADFGYDISNFYEIQSEYGTIADFKALIARAKSIGVKIILDFVPNHSSNESEWFKRSVNREKGFEDFYVWHDGYENPKGGKRLPPSNWLQAFRGSAWEWNDQRQQFYFHQYTVQQPDLNYRNPLVVEQMKRILRYWLDMGVDGFRVDAVPALFEVEPKDGRYPDEPKSGTIEDQDDYEYLNHIYTQNQPETIDMVYQWREVMDDYQRIHGGHTRVLLIETYAPVLYSMKMYGNSTTKGAHLPFNFNFITMLNKTSNAKDIEKSVAAWLNNMPPGQTANWVIGNHDRRRAASRYGTKLVDTMNMLVMTLPGASVTYQGEEIGMTDGEISWVDTVDPAACNSNPEIYEEFTRDPARTPFQWNNKQNAGFSTAQKTWLPIASGYETTNVESEEKDARSHLSVYKNLIKLRESNRILQFGDYRFQALTDDIFILERYLSNEERLIIVANISNKLLVVNIKQFDPFIPDVVKTILVNSESTKGDGSAMQSRNLSLSPYEALILTRGQ